MFESLSYWANEQANTLKSEDEISIEDYLEELIYDILQEVLNEEN